MRCTTPCSTLSLLAALLAGCGGGSTSSNPGAGGGPDAAAPAVPDAAPAPTLMRHTIGTVDGPSFAAVADVDGDGRLDVVVSAFGHATTSLPAGTVTLYTRGATLDDWTASPIVSASDGIVFPNQPTLTDVDGDGDLDVIVPHGFLICAIPFIPGAAPCGGLSWYEQTADGWTRHIITDKQERFYHHVELTDIDGDGTRDLVTVAEEQAFGGTPHGAHAEWWKGDDSDTRFESNPRAIGDGLGSLPQLYDIDGDGDLDVASAEFFVDGGSFAWFERNGDAWIRHVIDDQSGPSIQLTMVPNLTGDGTLHAVGANHVNTAKSSPDPEESAVFLFDVPADPTQPWTKHTISSGIVSAPGSDMAPIAAPGIFGVGDLDGDGDQDVAVSGDGDPHVYWLEQTAPGQFATHVLEDDLTQAGGMVIADLDGDGQNELVVTGYDADVVYVYARH